jgi:hypothetical protein
LEAMTNYEALRNGKELLVVGERGEESEVFAGFGVHLMFVGLNRSKVYSSFVPLDYLDDYKWKIIE